MYQETDAGRSSLVRSREKIDQAADKHGSAPISCLFRSVRIRGNPWLLNSSLLTSYSSLTFLLLLAAVFCLTKDAHANKVLTATPSSISFGNVIVNKSRTQTVTLTNTGDSSLKITQDKVTGTGFSIKGLSLPLTLAAGQSTTFSAIFAPTATGSVTGSVSITTSNSWIPPTTVSLSGTGITLLVTARPTSTSFGNIVLGGSSTLPVILYNTGTASVTLSQATVTGTGFSISGLSLPSTLAAGQDTNFSVTFAPTAAGSVTGNVSVVSNATNSPANEALSGTGIHAVNLSWADSSSQVAGYNVYRGSKSGGPYSKLDSSLVTQTTYTDTTVQAGQTYYYVTTAVDSSGNESAYSNEVQAVVP